ncbi:hypothetical protein KPH14_006395 [Odynerus spinipes]|uniref:Alpha-carbonic anhydrase domain-containing protein n=1 Tax=Odynerus spinipes TaxID=1348599 RepID=A0AAD9RZ52_9HYME|nr:hypothetical protein KPH14_006395 [Odynerus spinipes]
MEENDKLHAENAKLIQGLGSVEGRLESPINLDISNMTVINLGPLQWNHHNVAPRKVKVTNTGHTVILSANWQAERPYLTGGPLSGDYVFSQMHFHWGETEMRGSEHRVDGANMPMELHVVHFKTKYSTQEEALRQIDGVVMVVYLFKLQTPPNIFLKDIVNSLSSIKDANTSVRLVPVVLANIFKPFTDDYVIYWGSIITSQWTHRIMWLVSREPIGITKEQIAEFRILCDANEKPILRNYRPLRDRRYRSIFHVCPSGSLYATLLPISRKQLVLSSKAAADSNDTNREIVA